MSGVPCDSAGVGKLNVLVEGGSGTGKTAVCEELSRRGFDVVHGDRVLAYQGDPVTGVPVSGVTGLAVHDHHLWRADQVRALAADSRAPVTFFCGGWRKVGDFVDVFDAVLVLDVDLPTLRRRLHSRPADEWGGVGRIEERELIERFHLSGDDVPSGGVHIDATAPLDDVVDEILHRCHLGPDKSRD